MDKIYTKEILAYTAGLFDGEGHVGLNKTIYKDKPRYHLQIVIGSTDSKVLEFLLQSFGGNIYTPIKGGLGKKTFWHWQMSGHKCGSFLRLIEPYLIIKKEQAVIAIRFSETKVKSRYEMTEELRDYRTGIYKKLRFLNSGYIEGGN